MGVRIAVLLPTSVADPRGPGGAVRAAARLAEQVGLDAVWATDQLVATSPVLDSTAVLATAAAVTERIRLTYGVMVLSLRSVAWAAKQVSTVQLLSGNRLVLGIGTGNPAHGDAGWRAVGVPFAERGARTDEALRLLPGLVTGRPTTLGEDLDVSLTPAAAMPEVLIGGNGPLARRRAATYGDGWVSIGLSPEAVAAGLAEVSELAARLGRTAPTATVVAPLLDDDAGRAADQLASYAEAGTAQVVLPPTGPRWEDSYEHAARLLGSP